MKKKNYFWNDQNIFLITMFIGMALFVGFLPTDLAQPGIYPIAQGEGLVLCGESITLNAHQGIDEGELYDMFEEAMVMIEENCNEK